LSLRRTKDAEALTADWLHKNPDDTEIRYFVADRAIRSGNLPVAADQYQQILKKEPNKLALLHNLCWVYERLNDPRAIEIAETAYKLAPDDPGALHDLGRLLVQKGATARAISLLEQARTLAPASQAVRFQLAMAYAKSGDNARARSELEQLLRGRQAFEERAEAEALLKRLRN
jgi:Flp pilus assembly protein TadD